MKKEAILEKCSFLASWHLGGYSGLDVIDRHTDLEKI